MADPIATPWPEPRPPLDATLPAVPAGEARPWRGRLHPSLPDEVVWLCGVDALPSTLAGAFELTLDLRWRRFGCTRLFELGLHAHPKTGERPSHFVHTFHPTDRLALRPLHRLDLQTHWHIALVAPSRASQGQLLHAVEMRNTLGLRQLLQSAWSGA